MRFLLPPVVTIALLGAISSSTYAAELLYTIPDGWNKSNGAGGIVSLMPKITDIDSIAMIVIGPSQPLSGNLDASLSAAHSTIVRGLGTPVNTDKPEMGDAEGGSRACESEVKHSSGITFQVRSVGFATKDGKTFQTVHVCLSPGAKTRYSTEIAAFLRSIRFDGSPALPAPVATPTPSKPVPAPAGNNSLFQKPVAGDEMAFLRKVAPTGWSVSEESGRLIFRPTTLGAGEVVEAVATPRYSLQGLLITAFTDAFARAQVPKGSVLLEKETSAAAQTNNQATTYRHYRLSSGEERIGLYSSLSVDQQTARLITATASSTELLKRYQPQLIELMASAYRAEKREAVATNRGTKEDTLPPKIPNMKPGGPLQPGIYVGNGVYDGKIRHQTRLYLYDTGEACIRDGEGKEKRFGSQTFKYDPITGKLDISSIESLINSKSSPAEDYCVYGRDPQGKPFIYASEDRGLGVLVQVLKYEGPTDRPSPQEEKDAKAAAEAEARRYKLVLPAGQGLKPAQVEGVFYNSTVKYDATGTTARDDVYLLLKDGTLRDGIPVAFDELDVSLSKRREPEKWGKWRRQGEKVLVAWADNPTRFEPVKGTMAKPTRTGQKLVGHWGSGSTSGNFVTGSSYRIWGVTFTEAGGFQKDERGGSNNGSLAQTLNNTYIFTTYDEDGGTTSASAPGVIVGSVRKNTRRPSNRGTYTVNGFLLTLRYDNGKVERLPFFSSDDQKMLYFEGAILRKDDKK